MVRWLTVLTREALVGQHLILGPHMKVVEKSLHKVIHSSPHVHSQMHTNKAGVFVLLKIHTYLYPSE